MNTKRKRLLPFSYQAAKARAEANAVFFHRPYMVFTDTCGNWRCEQDNPRALHDKEVINPPTGKSLACIALERAAHELSLCKPAGKGKQDAADIGGALELVKQALETL